MVLAQLFRSPPISRADLARQTGLSRASVTTIVDDLAGLGIIEDGIPTTSARGRKSMGIKVVLDDFFVVVVRIERRDLTFRLYDGSGHVVVSEIRPFDESIQIDQLTEMIRDGIDRLVRGRDARHFLGISVAILGWLVETNKSIIAHTDGFSELGKTDIRAFIRREFPEVPVFLQHDAKTSALAEYHDHLSRTGERPQCLLNIIGGIGLGGGIIINGEVFRGQVGVAGEVGHLGVNFNSQVKRADADDVRFRGLLEDYASPRALVETVSSRLLDFPATCLSEESTPAEIYAAFEGGDQLAEWAMHRIAQIAAYGLAGLVFILNPGVIVLGDRLPTSPKFLSLLEAQIRNYLPTALYESLQVKVSRLGDDGVLFGAFLLLMQHYIRNRTLLERIHHARTGTPSVL